MNCYASSFRKLCNIGAVLSMTLLLASRTAFAVLYGNGQPDSNFTAAAQDPMFNGTVWVEGIYQGQTFITSATYLDPWNILFTYHQYSQAAYVKVGTGNHNSPGQTAIIASIVPCPGYNPDGSTPDLALIHLSSPLRLTNKVILASVSESETVWGSGYGWWGNLAGPFHAPDGQRRAWNGPISLDPGSGFNSAFYFSARFSGNGEYGSMNGVGFNLDSGGGWYDSARNLIGISDAGTGAGTIIQNLTNSDIQSWIYTNLIPGLRIESTASNAVVAWCTNAPGFSLQMKTDLTTTNWVNVTNTPATVSDEYQVTLPLSAGSVFFRLFR